MPRLVRLRELPLSLWPADTGGSREIAFAPNGRGGWDWRLQLAEVHVDMPVPAEPGTMRLSLLVSGAGMTVVIDGVTSTLTVGDMFSATGMATGSIALHDGPVSMLHLHTAPGVDAPVDVVDVTGEEVVPANTIAVVLAGAGMQVRADGGTPSAIQALDAVIVTRQPLTLQGSGRIACVRTPLPSGYGLRIADPALHCAPLVGHEWTEPLDELPNLHVGAGSGPTSFAGRMAEAR